MSTPQIPPNPQPWSEALTMSVTSAYPSWVQALQEEAAGKLRTSGLPNRKTESWKYTPMRLIEALDPGAAPELDSPGQDVFPEPLFAADAVVDIADGRVVRLPKPGLGLTLMPLAEALATHGAQLQPLMESQDLSGPHRALTALNTALLSEGLVIRVDPGVIAGSLLVRWAFSGGRRGRLGNFRLFVLLDEGATLELIEQFESTADSEDGLSVVSQFSLAEDARLEHVRLQRESENSLLLTETTVKLEGRSRYGYSGFDLGGRLVRHEIHVVVCGEDSEVGIRGAFVLDGSRYADNHVCIDHAVGGSRSAQYFRGVLGGRSRGVFNGRALIREGADGTSVYQSNANLLLSESAEMDSKPELEIYADEVEASHGATVGQLDEAAVFYLRSRGLSDAQARRMLTTAFCHAVTDALENRALSKRIAGLLDEAMPGNGEPEA